MLAVAGRTVALEAVDKAATLRLPQSIDNVLLTFRSKNSLIGLKGVLLTQELPGDLRFVAAPKEGQRRTRPTRAQVAIPVTLKRRGADVASEGVTVDMSLVGTLVECELELEKADEVELCLLVGKREATADGGGIVLFGTVTRVAHGLVAIEFAPASAQTHRIQIGWLVIEERRAARIRGAGQATQLEPLDF